MNADLASCAGCGRGILWITNENGKHEPFDARPTRFLVQQPNDSPTRPSEWAVLHGHIGHFITCPKADRFRGKV